MDERWPGPREGPSEGSGRAEGPRLQGPSAGCGGAPSGAASRAPVPPYRPVRWSAPHIPASTKCPCSCRMRSQALSSAAEPPSVAMGPTLPPTPLLGSEDNGVHREGLVGEIMAQGGLRCVTQMFALRKTKCLKIIRAAFEARATSLLAKVPRFKHSKEEANFRKASRGWFPEFPSLGWEREKEQGGRRREWGEGRAGVGGARWHPGHRSPWSRGVRASPRQQPVLKTPPPHGSARKGPSPSH